MRSLWLLLISISFLLIASDAFACGGSRGGCYTGCAGYSRGGRVTYGGYQYGGAVVGRGAIVGRGVPVPQGPIDIGVYPGHSFGMQPPAGYYPYLGVTVPGRQPVTPGQQIPRYVLPRDQALQNLKGQSLYDRYQQFKARLLPRIEAAAKKADEVRTALKQKGQEPYSHLLFNVTKQEAHYLRNSAPIYKVIADLEKLSPEERAKQLESKKSDLLKGLVKLELLEALTLMSETTMPLVTDGTKATMERALMQGATRVRAVYATDQTLLAHNPQTAFERLNGDYIVGLPYPYDLHTERFARAMRAGATHEVANSIQMMALGFFNRVPEGLPTQSMAIARR